MGSYLSLTIFWDYSSCSNHGLSRGMQNLVIRWFKLLGSLKKKLKTASFPDRNIVIRYPMRSLIS